MGPGGVAVPQANGAALALIALKQHWRSLPTRDQRQLPGQVVGILDTGIEAKTRGWGVTMGSIASEQDAFKLVFFGEDRLDHPVADLEYVHLQFGQLEQLANLLCDHGFIELCRVIRRHHEMENPVLAVASPGGWPSWHQRTAGKRAAARGMDEEVQHHAVVEQHF